MQKQYEGIYTDVELEYYVSFLNKKAEEDEWNDIEMKTTVIVHFNKTMHTLRVLMRLMGLEFHFKRLYARHRDDCTLDSLFMMINRCRKMYHAVQHLITIFKLLDKRR